MNVNGNAFENGDPVFFSDVEQMKFEILWICQYEVNNNNSEKKGNRSESKNKGGGKRHHKCLNQKWLQELG